MKTCSIEGCERVSRARGMCHFHYGRWRVDQPIRVMPEGHGSNPNPYATEVVALAAVGNSIATIMQRTDLNKNTVLGLIWRARQRGELPDPDFESRVETMAAQYSGFPRDPFPDRGGCLFPNAYVPRDPRFAFCGKPVNEPGGSWCPDCRKRVYHRPVHG